MWTDLDNACPNLLHGCKFLVSDPTFWADGYMHARSGGGEGIDEGCERITSIFMEQDQVLAFIRRV